MKWLILLISITTSFNKPYKNIIETYNGGVLETVTIKCNCLIATQFTSYKVNEHKFNPTRYLSNNVKVKDVYNVPPVIALGGKFKNLYKLGDTVRIVINNKLYKRVYGDNMNHKGKWKSINWNRNDILINKDDKFFTVNGFIIK